LNLDLLETLYPGIPAPIYPYCRMVDAEFRDAIDEIAPSIVHGGRYNPPGEFGVLYLAQSAECAYQEKLRQVHGKKAGLRPQVVGNFKMRLDRCLDLTSTRVLGNLGTTKTQLVLPDDYSVPRRIAKQARKTGFDALYVPSAAAEYCANLVVFKDRLAPPAFCVCDPHAITPFDLNRFGESEEES